MKTLSTFSLTLFSAVSLLALSACGAPSLPSSARFASQAILPPDAISPKPCNGNSFNSQAALPPGYSPPKPCGCNGFQSQAALPPGIGNPSHPSQPWNPKPCKP